MKWWVSSVHMMRYLKFQWSYIMVNLINLRDTCLETCNASFCFLGICNSFQIIGTWPNESSHKPEPRPKQGQHFCLNSDQIISTWLNERSHQPEPHPKQGLRFYLNSFSKLPSPRALSQITTTLLHQQLFLKLSSPKISSQIRTMLLPQQHFLKLPSPRALPKKRTTLLL